MNLCEPYFERRAVFDSYACRTGKGRLAAVQRAQHFARRNAWFLKCDVRKYFDSTILKRQLARQFKDARLLRLFSRIIDFRFNKDFPAGRVRMTEIHPPYYHPAGVLLTSPAERR